MKPKSPVDQLDTTTLHFCFAIMKNEPTQNKKNFSWEDFDSLGMRLDSNIGSGEKVHPLASLDGNQAHSANSIDQTIEDPYIELPDQTYRQIKDLNDALKIQARQITHREEKLSKLIVDFEREKREFDLKKLGSNDQIERRLDLLIAQSKRKTDRTLGATTPQDSDTPQDSELTKNTIVSGIESTGDIDATSTVDNKTANAGAPMTSPSPHFSKMKIAARDAFLASEFSKLIERKARSVEKPLPQPAEMMLDAIDSSESLIDEESESLESAMNEAIDTKQSELTDKREAAMKAAASVAAMQLGRFDAAQQKSIADALSDLTPPNYDTVDPDTNGPDPEISKRLSSSAEQLREKSEVLSAVFVELDQMVRDLDRQQELLEKIQVDRDSLSASEFELVNKKLKRRFNRISKKISVDSSS